MGGYPGVRTPNLDRLSRRGVLFTRAHTAAPACNPSRVALLSGLRPSTTGVYENDHAWRPAMPQAVMLPEHFRRNGYTVAGVGKIFHGGQNDERSWDYYTRPAGDPVPKQRPLNGIPKTAHFDWGPIDAPDEAMADWKVADWASEYLQREHEDPFFLAVGIYRPHLPWFVPRPYFERYPEASIRLPVVNPQDLDDVPAPGRRLARPEGDHRKVVESGNWEKAVQGYLASITFADACVGRVLDALDRSPHAENTIIVLWSDHGWHLGEKQHWRKFTLWEEATRVPLMVVAPGVTRPGQTSPRTVSLLDVYPTLTELCGLPPGEGVEGQSLVPLLRRPYAEWDRPVVTTYGRNNHAVRSERWRYIRYANGAEELYDHQDDPKEWTNLADRKELAEVKAQLAAWLPKRNAPNAPLEKDAEGDD